MTEAEIYDRLKPLIAEVTGARAEDVLFDSVLVEDLGAESIDLLDLTYLIEEEFGVTIQANELEKEAKAKIPGGVYEKDGFLTPEALEELRKALPEVDPERFVPGLRRGDLPLLLKVSVFVHLIQRKLAVGAGGVAGGGTRDG